MRLLKEKFQELDKTLKLKDKVQISDPCYDLSTWCSGTLENVLPGTYHCFLQREQIEKRISAIEIRHEQYLDVSPRFFSDIDVGVDSGQCGIYDLDYFKDVNGDEEWYKTVCDSTFDGNYFTADVLDEKCFVCAKGYGDGSYICKYNTRNKKIVSIGLYFIWD